MSDYVNPDYPTPGTSMFLKPQTTEMVDPGFYYAGGGFNPFNQMPMMNIGNNNQPAMGDSRRFFPDMPAQQPQQMGLNSFVEMNRRQIPSGTPMMQPSPVSPWAQINNPPVYPMNNNNMFMQTYVDPMSMRPYGNYSDMSHGQIVPPINKKMMWDEAPIPNTVYEAPRINWNSLQPQNQPYAPQMNQVNQMSGYNPNTYEPSVFVDSNRPVSWDERARSIWK